MEVIDNDFYKVNGLLVLLKSCMGLKPKRLWLRRLALLDNLNNYYRFSVSSVRLFQESFWKNLELISEGKKTEDDFDDKSHSSAIAFYSHSRVCIESSRLLSEEAVMSSSDEEKAELLQKHRDINAAWARDVIGKRNNITAHPHDVRRMIVGTPSSWGSNGKIKFNTTDLEHVAITHSEYELEPVEDLKKLKKYIEETIAHLKSIWAI